MNDYVSYTVIATGFDSARKTFKSAEPKQQTKGSQEALQFRGGFNFMDTDNINKEDLEVPTILRVKSPNSTIDEPEEENEENDPEEKTFSIDASRYSWAKQKMEHDNQKKKKDDDDDDEGSSFLRMIMD